MYILASALYITDIKLWRCSLVCLIRESLCLKKVDCILQYSGRNEREDKECKMFKENVLKFIRYDLLFVSTEKV